jgi:hypothetical protein
LIDYAPGRGVISKSEVRQSYKLIEGNIFGWIFLMVTLIALSRLLILSVVGDALTTDYHYQSTLCAEITLNEYL